VRSPRLKRARKRKGASIETFTEKPGACLVEVQDTQLVAVAIEKEEKGPVTHGELEI